jgi:O-antigen ligase
MLSIKLVAVLLLLFETVAFIFNYKKGLGVFLFIYIVFPDSLKILDFLNLNILRLAELIALLFFIREIFLKNRIKKDIFPLWSTILLFSVFLLPSYLLTEFSEGFPKGIYNYIIYFFADTFLPGLIVFYSVENIKDLRVVFKWLIFAIVVMTAYGILEYVMGFKNIFWNLMEQEFKTVTVYDYQGVDDRLGFSNRVKSTNIHPIVYGGRLALFVPLFLMLIADSRSWKILKSNFILIAIFVMLIINVFLTISRSCWISALIAVLVVFFLKRKQYFKRYTTLKLILAICVVPFLIYVIPVIIRILSKADFNGSSVSLRTGQYDYIFNVIVAKQFYFGFGPDSITSFLSSGIYLGALGFESIIFEIFVKNGFFGFIGYLIFYVGTIKYVLRSNKFKYAKSYFLATTIAHLAFIIITGERYTLVLYFLFVCIYIKINLLVAQEAALSTTNNDENE